MSMYHHEHKNENGYHYHDEPCAVQELCRDKNGQDHRRCDRSNQIDSKRPFPVLALSDLIADQPRYLALLNSKIDVGNCAAGFNVALMYRAVLRVFVSSFKPVTYHS